MLMQYVGGVATYQCVNKSYTLIGPSTRQCLENVTWSRSTPTCISKYMYNFELLIHSSSWFELSVSFSRSEFEALLLFFLFLY